MEQTCELPLLETVIKVELEQFNQPVHESPKQKEKDKSLGKLTSLVNSKAVLIKSKDGLAIKLKGCSGYSSLVLKIAPKPVVQLKRLEEAEILQWTKLKRRRKIKLDHRCEFCEKSFSSQRALSVHRINHPTASSWCVRCSRTFKLKAHYHYHMNSRHMKFPFGCDECDFETIHERHLQRHKDRHRKKECPVCHKMVGSLEVHMFVHDSSRVSCDICGKKVVNIAYHMRNNHEKVYSCPMCDGPMFSRHEIKMHNLKFHSQMLEAPEEQSVEKRERTQKDTSQSTKCPICQKMVVILKNHMKSIHPKVKAQCGVCAHIMTNDNLTRHVHHHHRKLRPCSICKQKFILGDFKRHKLKVHHPDPLFECSECDEVFKTDSELHQHRVVSESKPKTCDICGESYRNHSSHTEHWGEKHGATLYFIHLNNSVVKMSTSGVLLTFKVEQQK